MAKFTMEMAFDWDTGIEEGQTDRLLEVAAQKYVSGGWQAANFANLRVGDQMLFPLFDNSASTTAVKTVTAFEVKIVDSQDTSRSASPFALELPTLGGPQQMFPGTSSTYRTATLRANPLGDSYRALVNAGRYLVTITLEVQLGSEKKTFKVDPEWIVGG